MLRSVESDPNGSPKIDLRTPEALVVDSRRSAVLAFRPRRPSRRFILKRPISQNIFDLSKHPVRLLPPRNPHQDLLSAPPPRRLNNSK